MYQTCLFCSHAMGHNQVLEDLPIGRRVAFDAARGRLWVICRRCERWNLVPFDRRLEAIEAAERVYRTASLRYSTGQIGLARLREGLELVRIGAPERPEFAAWRYGDQFGRRRRRSLVYGAAAATGILGLSFAGIAVGAGLGGIFSLANLAVQYRYSVGEVGRLRDADGQTVVLTRQGLALDARLRRPADGAWELVLPVQRPDRSGRMRMGRRNETITLVGDQALEALRQVLPGLNQTGGRRQEVEQAVGMVGGADLPHLLKQAMGRQSFLHLYHMPAPMRLAAEMLSHEAAEQAALDGELALLLRQWRHAEELAGIADHLALQAAEGADHE